jgi:hypothetical protein
LYNYKNANYLKSYPILSLKNHFVNFKKSKRRKVVSLLLQKEDTGNTKNFRPEKSFLLFAAQVMKKKKDQTFIQQDKSTV